MLFLSHRGGEAQKCCDYFIFGHERVDRSVRYDALYDGVGRVDERFQKVSLGREGRVT